MVFSIKLSEDKKILQGDKFIHNKLFLNQKIRTKLNSNIICTYFLRLIFFNLIKYLHILIKD